MVTIQRIITAAAFVGLMWSVFFYAPPLCLSSTLAIIALAIAMLEWKNLFSITKIWFWIILPWYPLLPFGMLIYLNQSPQYRMLVFFIFVITCSFDSGAYLIGKLYGRHKILPTISPKKTVEGTVGGYLIATMILFVTTRYFHMTTNLTSIILISSVSCCAAFFGDAFESYLKRRAKIKDSSHILPGHGGLLDRFDAILFVTVFFFLCRVILAKQLT